MTQELREQVAEALYNDKAKRTQSGGSWSHTHPESRDIWCKHASAAIAVIQPHYEAEIKRLREALGKMARAEVGDKNPFYEADEMQAIALQALQQTAALDHAAGGEG